MATPQSVEREEHLLQLGNFHAIQQLRTQHDQMQRLRQHQIVQRQAMQRQEEQMRQQQIYQHNRQREMMRCRALLQQVTQHQTNLQQRRLHMRQQQVKQPEIYKQMPILPPHRQPGTPETHRLELRRVSSAIEKRCAQMYLEDNVATRAIQILEQFITDTRHWTSRHAMMAACIFIACRECNQFMIYAAVCTALRTPIVQGLGVLLMIENVYYRHGAQITGGVFRVPGRPFKGDPSGGLGTNTKFIPGNYSTKEAKLIHICRPSSAASCQLDLACDSIESCCKIMNLDGDVPGRAVDIYKGAHPEKLPGYDTRRALQAASIFLACRDCGQFVEYRTIINLMVKRLSRAMSLTILLGAEKTHYQESEGKDGEKATGSQSLYQVSCDAEKPTYTSPTTIGTIWLQGRQAIIIRDGYNTIDPRIMDLCCQSPKIDSQIKPEDSKSMPADDITQEAVHGDEISSTDDNKSDWELLELIDKLSVGNSSELMTADIGTIADTASGGSGGWTLC